jgi:hypothetical protein
MTGPDMTTEEFLDMADKTRAQLAEENEELRARVAELEDVNTQLTTRPAPVLPSWGLSEGTRLDILEAQNRIRHEVRLTAVEITEPFTGKLIRVTEDNAVLLDGDESEDVTPEPVAPEPADPDQV